MSKDAVRIGKFDLRIKRLNWSNTSILSAHAPDYRHTDKYLRMVITIICSNLEGSVARGKASSNNKQESLDKCRNGHTDLPSTLSPAPPCYMQSMIAHSVKFVHPPLWTDKQTDGQTDKCYQTHIHVFHCILFQCISLYFVSMLFFAWSHVHN